MTLSVKHIPRSHLLACIPLVAALIAFPAGSLAQSKPSASAKARTARVHATIAVAPRDPAVNRTLPQVALTACATAPAGPACTIRVLAAIDAARASEGVRPMRLPADYRTLSPAEQLLVVTDLERVDRGLVPAIGLSPSLNRRALAGARNGTDPELTPMFGNWAGSNWAGGYPSPLEADFEWMYDDGAGSPNRDCTAAGATGCWGHRDNILAAYQAPLAMGAAVDGGSMAELFMGHDLQTGANQPDALAAPRWPAVTRS